MLTVTFEEQGGFTTVTTFIDYGSKASRDTALSTGMSDGMESNFQVLDRLLEEGG